MTKDHRAIYVKEIEALTRVLRQRAFHELWTEPERAGEWYGRPTPELAFLCAVLHRFTRRAEYLTLARQHLLAIERCGHYSALFTFEAYALLKKKLSAAERAEFGRRRIADAREAMNRFAPGDPHTLYTQPTLHNPTLCACVMADLVRHHFLRACRPLAFEKKTHAVWHGWWGHREWHEQASHYEGFALAHLCAWADLRKARRDFYHTASVVNLFERGARIVAPAGIVTAYGDSGHNEHAAAWAAVFEKAAQATRNGEWKQTAFDIFSYLQRRDWQKAAETLRREMAKQDLSVRRLQYGSFIRAVAWLGMAALWSDPKLAPQPRVHRSGVVARLPVGFIQTPEIKKRLPAREMVADQAALIGGAAEGGFTYLLLSAGAVKGYGHRDPSAILMLSRGDSVLLGSAGSFANALPQHNAFYVQPSNLTAYPDLDWWRARPLEKYVPGTVQDLKTDGSSSYVRLFFSRFDDLPVVVTRDVIADASGLVTLMDRVIAGQSGLCGGPLFQAESVRKVKPNAFVLRQERLRSQSGFELENAPGTLRVEFAAPASRIETRLNPPLDFSHQPGHDKFPGKQYARLWGQSYTARTTLSARCDLPQGREILFVTHLIPVMPAAAARKG